jgi:hypothetical protein
VGTAVEELSRGEIGGTFGSRWEPKGTLGECDLGSGRCGGVYGHGVYVREALENLGRICAHGLGGAGVSGGLA